MQGLAGYLIPVMLLLCGILLWFSPAQRTFYSLLAIVLALGSWITSNLGGFFIGMMLGLVGGALAVAWTTAPDRQPLTWFGSYAQILQSSWGLEVIVRPTAALPVTATTGDASLPRAHPLLLLPAADIVSDTKDPSDDESATTSPGTVGLVTGVSLTGGQQTASGPATGGKTLPDAAAAQDDTDDRIDRDHDGPGQAP